MWQPGALSTVALMGSLAAVVYFGWVLDQRGLLGSGSRARGKLIARMMQTGELLDRGGAGELVTFDKSGLKTLAALLRDERPDVRRGTLFCVQEPTPPGARGAKPDYLAAADVVAEAAFDESPAVRDEALRALATISSVGREHDFYPLFREPRRLQWLLGRLVAEQDWQQVAAACVLANMVSLMDTGAEHLRELLEAGSSEDRTAILSGLRLIAGGSMNAGDIERVHGFEIGMYVYTADRKVDRDVFRDTPEVLLPATTSVLQCLRDPSPDTQHAALFVLDAINHADGTPFFDHPLFAQALIDTDTAGTLARMGEEGDADSGPREAAKRILDRGWSSPPAQAILLPHLLQHPEEATRAATLRRAQRRRITPSQMSDDFERYRTIVELILRCAGEESDAVRVPAICLLAYADWMAVHPAFADLFEAAQPQLLPALLASGSHPDSEVRDAAFKLLGRLAGLARPRAAVLARLLESPRPEIRAEALRALERNDEFRRRAGPELAQNPAEYVDGLLLVLRCLEDPDAGVRQAAVELLARLHNEQGSHIFARRTVIEAIQAGGGLPLLLHLTTVDDPAIQHRGEWLFGSLFTGDGTPVALEWLLAKEEPELRALALKRMELGSFDALSRAYDASPEDMLPLITKLCQTVADPAPQVRDAAIDLFAHLYRNHMFRGRLSPKQAAGQLVAAGAVDVLLTAMRTDGQHRASLAASLLGAIAWDLPEVVVTLEQLQADPDVPEFRRAAAQRALRIIEQQQHAAKYGE